MGPVHKKQSGLGTGNDRFEPRRSIERIAHRTTAESQAERAIIAFDRRRRSLESVSSTFGDRSIRRRVIVVVDLVKGYRVLLSGECCNISNNIRKSNQRD